MRICVLLLKSPSQKLRMLEEAYSKATMKETQAYGWHKRSREIVNNHPRCGRCSWSRPQWFYSRRAYCEQRNVRRVLCRLRDEVRRKRPEKWEQNVVSFTRQRTWISAIIGQKYLAKYIMTALENREYFPDLSQPDFYLFLRLKCVCHLRGCHCKSEESRQGYRKMVSTNTSKTFTKVGKSLSLYKELNWRKRFVNICKIPYLYVVN